MMKRAGVGFILLVAACAPPYAYSFDVHPPVEDRDLAAQIVVDPAADSVALAMTNKTDQVLQVEWAAISVSGVSDRAISLRPDTDLGWIQPGATVSARLFPLSLPRRGGEAAAYEGRRLDVTVPVIVRREPRQYHYSLTAHVRKL